MLILLIGVIKADAQEAVLTSGGTATGSGGNVSYSIGQVLYSYQSGAAASLNQGVQQPYEFYSVGIDEDQSIRMTMLAYPNPATTSLNLFVERPLEDQLTFKLYDVNGKMLILSPVTGKQTRIPMEELSPGTYLLSVSNIKTTIKTFTIIKNL